MNLNIKCVHCGKSKGDHSSKLMNCPVPPKLKKLGYLYYHPLNVFKASSEEEIVESKINAGYFVSSETFKEVNEEIKNLPLMQKLSALATKKAKKTLGIKD